MYITLLQSLQGQLKLEREACEQKPLLLLPLVGKTFETADPSGVVDGL